jgi:hypothetical protein
MRLSADPLLEVRAFWDTVQGLLRLEDRPLRIGAG